ncbi:MAG: prepilin-type N-terminal cleavage/methylation domain-containing protein [Proteobacteria bacterium]|nr:prepilin-type N-terminal cleavage/methylation domain-containing protein [Pseudomonadota bacterium]MBU1386462.1 prepilin-type N-terminal cleavage/methylation domain-containing protein [Pseudomonadota bacterium]MBU1544573.1 prepilin-type N-terminal cleavage/methylation domain-containing protein [Pseudomonadota bacterium]MBU2431785.1 prepilin-type N-terminal cleavage/methylation domain-containing protein [Pseudomonadota bacterium]MBU2481216.1 prepilin-type N-terminal cleavage/methylation domain
MKPVNHQTINNSGFTLIEVIIGIVMVSIAAVIMMSFLESGLTQSHTPLDVLSDNYDIYRSMEIVNADYRAKLEQDASQDIGFYVGADLSSKISGLSGASIKGGYIDFSDPDVNRQVTETAAAGATMYVKITAQKNNSKMISILGN